MIIRFFSVIEFENDLGRAYAKTNKISVRCIRRF